MSTGAYTAGVVAGVVMIILSFVFFSMALENLWMLLLFLIFLIVGINVIRLNVPKLSKSLNVDAQKRCYAHIAGESGALAACCFAHAGGLPVGDNATCWLRTYQDKLVISCQSAHYNLSYSQITGAEFRYETDPNVAARNTIKAASYRSTYYKGDYENECRYVLYIRYVDQNRCNSVLKFQCADSSDAMTPFRDSLYSKLNADGGSSVTQL